MEASSRALGYGERTSTICLAETGSRGGKGRAANSLTPPKAERLC